jgi:nicotinate-nucleotide adenylyltransferase
MFGGTFDPPHLGHVSAAREVADALALDEVVWVPARRSPHKLDGPLTPVAIRTEMVETAVALDGRFRLSRIEIDRPGPSWTVDTLRWFRKLEPADTEIYLLMGLDQFRAFDTWNEPDEVRRLATLVVMDRDGEGVDNEASVHGGVVCRVPVRRVDVSSSAVRATARAGGDIAGLVPPGVAGVIRREGLYSD